MSYSARRPLLRVPPALVGPALLGGLSTRVGFPAAEEADRELSRGVLGRALGIDPTRMAWAHQVHGATVVEVGGPGAQGDADALVDPRGLNVLLVTVADCCPVLLWEEQGPAIGIAHAGWRGLVAGVLPSTVAKLADRSIDVTRLRAWIGPCISVDNFEVGQEVAERFDDRFVVRGAARPHVDLRAAAVEQLVQAGLRRAAVTVCADDTYARRELYWSYRRDRGIKGRHLAYLGRTRV